MSWQRANIQAAATYLRERMNAGANDPRTRAVYEGLLEVLDPNRRTVRVQREAAMAAAAAVTVPTTRDRRSITDRRTNHDRRRASLSSPTGIERRTGIDRRTGRDRRHGR